MATATPTRTRHRVFVNYAGADRGLVDRLTVALARAGLTTIRADELTTGGVYNDAVRRALVGSAAMVVPLSGMPRTADLPASALFEIGAAMGAGKPVYVVVDSPTYRVPFGAPGVRVLFSNQLDEIGRDVLAADVSSASQLVP